jgi:hypothetical protein
MAGKQVLCFRQLSRNNQDNSQKIYFFKNIHITYCDSKS